jgi:hypothetical protein
MHDSSINFKIKNKVEKSSIIKLSDIDYVKNFIIQQK